MWAEELEGIHSQKLHITMHGYTSLNINFFQIAWLNNYLIFWPSKYLNDFSSKFLDSQIILLLSFQFLKKNILYLILYLNLHLLLQLDHTIHYIYI